MAWSSPTGFVDPNNKWLSETRIYDGDTETAGSTAQTGYYVELTHSVLLCDKILIRACDVQTIGGGRANPNIAIDVYYSGAWHNIFSGTITKDTNVQKAIGSNQLVTAARIKYNSITYSFGCISIFGFNEAAPAAPTNVAATDGVHTDKVTVTWTKSVGATGYKVYRDDGVCATVGDVASADDFVAGAPSITPGAAAASDGTSYSHVSLSISGQSTSNGYVHTYKVRATNDAGESGDSSTDTGYRGVGSLTYQWQRSAGDSNANYSNISGATSSSYNDTGAPTDGSGRYYRCVLNAAGASQRTSSADRGYRIPISTPTVTTQAVSDIATTTATSNQNITDNGGENCDKRGTVYGTSSQGDPGDVAPGDSGYDDYEEETDSFGTGAFTRSLTGLTPGQTYYARGYAHNSAGYSYGPQVEFTTREDFERKLSATIGLSASMSRATTLTRSLTSAIGLQSSLDSEGKNRGSWLCIASRDGGSIKTRSGASWSTCAQTDALGALPGSYFAQYLNRLCVLNYEKMGFSHSAEHDIVADWTNKPDFPNLPQKFTELFVARDAGDDPTLNFLTPTGMYYLGLDSFTTFVFGPTECLWEEDEHSGKKGLYWKGDHYIAVGKGIYKISSGVVDLVGPDMDDGLPENLQGIITDMIGMGFWLVIALDGGASKKSCILKRYISGKHWHPVYVGSLDTPIRALFWDSGTLYFGEGSDVKSLPFPNTTDNVKQLSDHDYCETGELIYPYFHSIFEAMPKVAHKVWATTQDCNSDEKITLSYRKDEETGWTELGMFESSPRPDALPFPASGDSIGVEFERIQFKVVFAKGETPTTDSPKLESLILEFRVTPPVLLGWDVRVLATTSGDRRGQDIIDAMLTAIREPKLLSFYPSGDKSKTEYFVEVKGMPGVRKGTAFGEEGIYDLSVEEVID